MAGSRQAVLAVSLVFLLGLVIGFSIGISL
jgi:hypothetical protein